MSAVPGLAPADLEGVGDLRTIGLEEATRAAALQMRTDAKYLLPADRVADLLAAVAPHARVLEVGGVLGTDYRTTYFDTAELWSYRAHLQRRRRRAKVRTRRYGDGLAMLEVKVKTSRGDTDKRRIEHPAASSGELGAAGRAFIAGALRDGAGLVAPAPLAARATTSFHRTTLVDPDAGERITIDRDLVGTFDDAEVRFGTGHMLVEVKAATWRGAGHRVLRGLGVRPRSFSKYCLTVGALHPTLPSNPWRPVVRALGIERARLGPVQASEAG